VVQVTPASVPMAFEASASKIVPLVPAVEGAPAAGFVVGGITADPATVEVVGPARALGALSEAITEPVSVEGAVTTLSSTVNVGVEDPALRVRGVRTARVTVAIAAATAEWTVTRVPVQARHATRALTVDPPFVTLTVRGPRGALRATAEQFDAFVDTGSLGAGRYQLPVRVVPPAGVGVERVEPANAGVTIR
jgi:YbbR domain-containing protein